MNDCCIIVTYLTYSLPVCSYQKGDSKTVTFYLSLTEEKNIGFYFCKYDFRNNIFSVPTEQFKSNNYVLLLVVTTFIGCIIIIVSFIFTIIFTNCKGFCNSSFGRNRFSLDQRYSKILHILSLINRIF